MMMGPMILTMLLLTIVSDGSGWLTTVDFAFLAVLSALLLARWVEFRDGNPRTSTGEQATPGHLRRYVLNATAAGLGAWVIAKLIGNHWLNR